MCASYVDSEGILWTYSNGRLVVAASNSKLALKNHTFTSELFLRTCTLPLYIRRHHFYRFVFLWFTLKNHSIIFINLHFETSFQSLCFGSQNTVVI